MDFWAGPRRTRHGETVFVMVLLAMSATAYRRSMRTHNSFRCFSDRASIVNGYYEALDASTVIKAHCHNGYRLVGSEIRQCNSDERRYTGTPPICVDIDECAIMEEGSGSGWGTSDAEDDVRSCDVNATCENTHGGYRCVCHEGLVGTGYSCKEPQCPQPVLENGRVILLGPEGNIARYFCNPSYLLIGTSVLRCQNRMWVPSTQPRCRPKARCPDPGQLENGDIVGDHFFPGNTIHYLCKTGYQIVGPRRRNCTRMLKWSPSYPPICREPDTLGDIAKQIHVALKEMANHTTSSRIYKSDARFSLIQPDGIDLFLLFDGSSSVGSHHFRLGVNFTDVLLTELGVSNTVGATRLAAIAFGSTLNVAMRLDESLSIEEARRKLASLQPPGGGTNLAGALTKVSRMIFGNKQNITKKRIMFVMSDGRANVGDERTTIARATALRVHKKVEIYTIGVGPDVDRKQLESIASTPIQEHVYLLDSYQQLEELRDKVLDRRMDYEQCGISGNTEIPGGRGKSKYGSWPWLVQVYRRGTGGGERMVCGGTIICDRWVLTAAQCFRARAPGSNTWTPLQAHQFRVRVGVYNWTDQDQGVLTMEVADIHRFSSDLETGLVGDIALVRLKTPIPLAKYYRTLCVPRNDSNEVITHSPWRVSTEKNLVIAGWGTTGIPAHFPPFFVPKQEKTRIQDSTQCRNLIKNVTGSDNNEQLACIGERSHDTGRGDIGGPVMMERSGDKHYIHVGVVTHNSHYDPVRGTTVITKTLSYLDWIRQTTKGCALKYNCRGHQC